jgi:hypothetical protein
MPCASCRSPLSPLFGACPACGALRVDAFEECPGCERPVDARWLYCQTCGDRLEHQFYLQGRGFSCGPAAVRNALAVLGIAQTEPFLRDVMGARAFRGTPDEGFAAAAAAVELEHIHVVDGDIDRLRSETDAGSPCVLDWRHGRHYVCAVAVTSRHVLFADSNPRDVGMVRLMTHARFNQLWWDSDDDAERHHAMHVFRRKRPPA